MKRTIKILPIPAQNGSSAQFVASVEVEDGDKVDLLKSVPYPTSVEAVKHLVRLDPDLFVDGYDLDDGGNPSASGEVRS